uniref:hypothetical protein n=1 Tax=unclassified Wolbachia TaxID=2640676 RepID=UPI0022260A19|nr:hypothetical protein [Wolbachia endosymbiont (group A) of Sphecodes monilicornis]
MIARFCIANKPALWKPIAPEMRHLRELYRCMQSLKDDKVQQTNRLENKNMHSSCKEAISKVILAIEEQIIVLEKEINEHINIAFLIIVRTGHRKAESTARRKDSNRGMFFLALFFIANQ